MNPLPGNHTQETLLITEVNHLTEIGEILMILLGVHTLKEEMTGMIALIHMDSAIKSTNEIKGIKQITERPERQ